MLLSTKEFKQSLGTALKQADSQVIILSAFLKKEALNWLLKNSESKSIKVVSRWRKNDLVAGASDFECYELCKKVGIDFGVSLDLHGKVYLVRDQIFVGSSNLTSKGIGLSSRFNDEFGTVFKAGLADKEKLSAYLNDVVWLDDDITSLIKKELDKENPTTHTFSNDWSVNLTNSLESRVRHLWVHELLFSKPEDLLSFNSKDRHQIHDFEMLGLDLEDLNLATLATTFQASHPYKWLDQVLMVEKSLSFGRISKLLHDALLDDPAPYRREVKQLVANLYSWFKLSKFHQVTRPRHSQIIERLE